MWTDLVFAFQAERVDLLHRQRCIKVGAYLAQGNMIADQPSRTAHRVALRRAIHQLWDNPRVFDDPVALRIVEPEEAAELARSKPVEPVAAQRLRAFLVARSRYAEDQLAEAVARGVQQYVILGAGLDTFAYRNPFPLLRVFEVDYPATQAWKRERLTLEEILKSI
jgi:methyltransferase (TIGR00027 family)